MTFQPGTLFKNPIFQVRWKRFGIFPSQTSSVMTLPFPNYQLVLTKHLGWQHNSYSVTMSRTRAPWCPSATLAWRVCTSADQSVNEIDLQVSLKVLSLKWHRRKAEARQQPSLTESHSAIVKIDRQFRPRKINASIIQDALEEGEWVKWKKTIQWASMTDGSINVDAAMTILFTKHQSKKKKSVS